MTRFVRFPKYHITRGSISRTDCARVFSIEGSETTNFFRGSKGLTYSFQRRVLSETFDTDGSFALSGDRWGVPKITSLEVM